ncbi:MAG: glycosyltransferase, partial [Planctomycetota bacterium]
VPVIASALHSTGWPDSVGRLNRMLTPITDAFIGVAKPHGEHLVHNERFPAERVHVIPNGVDTERFAPLAETASIRDELSLPPTAPAVGILAALRPEKNHELFLIAASQVLNQVGDARFVIIGDGPRRSNLEAFADELGIANAVSFLGNRDDVPRVLAALDVVALTSHNEANPVSILEAMSVGKPVVTTDVGSVRETVKEGVTGYVVPVGDEVRLSERLVELLCDPLKAHEMGARGRRLVEHGWSLQAMVSGYERLLESLYLAKTGERLTAEENASAAESPAEAAAV